ncbi:MAG TPA: GNAT family N-acetyltransferase [Burkholderiaceae bacterium]|nr:GNAT family N-acetyltransferase [Burkholderiaceae bacterium]
MARGSSIHGFLPMSDTESQRSISATGTDGEPVNFYASTEFLDVVSKVYFPSQSCRIEDFDVEGKVFRLLTMDGWAPAQVPYFLDMHEALRSPERHSRRRKLRRLARVSHGMIGIEEFRSNTEWSKFLGAPTVVWSHFASWTEYLELLRKRRVLPDDQRRRRRLEELLGPLEFKVDDTKDDVLPTCFSWRMARDRSEGYSDIIFAREENRAFFYELRARGLLRASTLRANGQLLAIWLGVVYLQRWSGWVFAFNPEPSLAKYSLGRQLLFPMLEESYRAGDKEFDFSIGAEAYKLFFATHVRAVGLLGTPTIREQIEVHVKGLLKERPWMYQKAKALRNWLASVP